MKESEPLPSSASPQVPGRFWLRHSLAFRDLLIGIALGTAAPLGAFLMRWTLGAHDPAREFHDHAFFYLYELAGTCTVFGIGGYLEGRRADRLRRGRDRFRVLAERDDLTELPNRRSFQTHFRRAAARSMRFGEPVAILMVDVDELKKINDRFGHAAGNAALLHVAEALRESKREEDMAARWGGDEFAILMPGAAPEAAGRLAESILHRLNTRPLSIERRPLFVTVTIGIAGDASPRSLDALFRKADAALYSAKAAGRNCFRLAGVGAEERGPGEGH